MLVVVGLLLLYGDTLILGNSYNQELLSSKWRKLSVTFHLHNTADPNQTTSFIAFPSAIASAFASFVAEPSAVAPSLLGSSAADPFHLVPSAVEPSTPTAIAATVRSAPQSTVTPPLLLAFVVQVLPNPLVASIATTGPSDPSVLPLPGPSATALPDPSAASVPLDRLRFGPKAVAAQVAPVGLPAAVVDLDLRCPFRNKHYTNQFK